MTDKFDRDSDSDYSPNVPDLPSLPLSWCGDGHEVDLVQGRTPPPRHCGCACLARPPFHASTIAHILQINSMGQCGMGGYAEGQEVTKSLTPSAYHHILGVSRDDEPEAGQYAAIESALADYFACSFLNNPKLGEQAAKVYQMDKPYIRLLANDRKFTEFDNVRDFDTRYAGAEIWGGAFWAIRAKLGAEVADPIFAAAWLSLALPDEEADRAQAYISVLLARAAEIGAWEREGIEAVLRAREFPLPR